MKLLPLIQRILTGLALFIPLLTVILIFSLAITGDLNLPGIAYVLFAILAVVAALNWFFGRLFPQRLKERENTRLHQSWLSSMELTAAQAERNRLARDLHDSIKQQLFSIQMSTAAAQTRWNTDPAAAQDALADVRKSTEEALVEMNALLQQLSPVPLEKVGLVQALHEQCEAIGYRTGANVSCEIGSLPAEDLFPPGAKEAIFRIVQEAFSNIARHARAQSITLHLHVDEALGNLNLRIADDGSGFDPASVPNGMGISGMRTRVAELSGQITLTATPGAGTEIRATIPLQEPAALPALSVHKASNRLILLSLALGFIAAATGALLVQIAGVGYLLAGLFSALLMLASGYIAVRKSDAQMRKSRILTGAAAGAVTALAAYGWLGAAWLAMAGASALLANGTQPVSAERSVWLVSEAVTGIFWWGHIGFWISLLLGTGLGGIGGMFGATRSQQITSAATWQPLTFITALLESSAFAILIATFGLTIGEGALIATANHHNVLHDIFFSPYGISAWGIGTPGLIYLVTLNLRRNLLQMEEKEGVNLLQLHWKAYAFACLAFSIPLLCWGFFSNPELWDNTMGGGWQTIAGPVLSTGIIGILSIVQALAYLKKVETFRQRMLQVNIPLPHPAAYAVPVIAPLIPLFALLAVIAEFPGWLVLAALVVEGALLLILRLQKSAPRSQALFTPRPHPGSLPEAVIGLILPVLPLSSSLLSVYTLCIRLVPYLEAQRQLGAETLPTLTHTMLTQQAQVAQAGMFTFLLIVTLAGYGLYLLSVLLANLNRRRFSGRL